MMAMSGVRSIRKRIDVLLLLVVLPAAGLVLSGRPVGDYLGFPPLTRYVPHAGFSWLVFALMAAGILAAVGPFVARVLASQAAVPAPPPRIAARRLPWWGWFGLALAGVGWVLAWTRFAWFAPWQSFTFSPMWLGYILVVNALTWRRSGVCMMLQAPWRFAGLFAVSAAFWWYFEYLNRFVQNWYYVGADQLSRREYFIFATLPFATVLPAVLGTYDLLATYPRLSAGLAGAWPLKVRRSAPLALGVFVAACAGLAGIGRWPDQLFPLLWVAPLLVITSLQVLRGELTVFAGVERGDWRRVCLLAVSALVCGFFWEMWNYRSAARWVYAVPYVQGFKIFEMPLLGFAGYLPFGLECAIVSDFLLGPRDGKRDAPAAAAPLPPGEPPPRWLGLCRHGNAALLIAAAVYFFLAPGVRVFRDLADPALRGPQIPAVAWRLHRSLTPRYERWARQRIASGAAGRLALHDVPSTEWPIFGSVYYLWATESLQAAWEKDHSLSPRAPRETARAAIEAAADLVVDPVHHTWVRMHWGDDYLHDRNVFFRSLIIAALTSYERLTGDGRHRALLRDQVDSLAADLEASPLGVLEDYPGECYPIDVFAAVAFIKRADAVLGTDHSAFLAREIRAFQGPMLDACGLVPYTMDYLSGEHLGPSRGVGNSFILIFAPELWPEATRDWYDRYVACFWQDKGWAAGFREFPRGLPGTEWTYDVDAGPILAGFSPAANAFAIAACKVNGRLDHAWPITAQALAASWPLPDGSLLGPRILSSQVHAPYLGEACMLFFLTQQPAPGLPLHTGGALPGLIAIGYVFYFGVGGLLVSIALLGVGRWRRLRMRLRVRWPAGQAAAWVILLAGAAALFATGHIVKALGLLLVAQMLPRPATLLK